MVLFTLRILFMVFLFLFEIKTNEGSTFKIQNISIFSDISSRYARTTIVKSLENDQDESGNVLYSVTFPEEAYVTAFVIETNGQNHTAHIQGRTNATKGSGTSNKPSTSFDERDSNRVTFNMDVRSRTQMAFYLTYEQLLKRHNGYYEHIINIPSDLTIQDFSIQVLENTKIINMETSIFLCKGTDCKSISLKETKFLNLANNKVKIIPNITEIAAMLKTNGNQNVGGQFAVKYDVERNAEGGEILQRDGYCAHYFAPKYLTPLPKYIVFILDTSGSMFGSKLQLLKDAMLNILDKLRDYDLFNIVEFNWNTKIWNSDKKATTKNIESSKKSVRSLQADGSTNMYDALQKGLNLVEQTKAETEDIETLIMFLTDGEPSDLTKDEIVEKITDFNVDSRKCSIFTLGFGESTDYNFLNRLAEKNGGFTKRIYEASDASIELQDFYARISSPLLNNVTFMYESSVQNLTRTRFSTYFNGSELVVSGRCGASEHPNVVVEGWTNSNKVTFIPDVIEVPPEIDPKRTWVNVQISQALEEAVIEEDNSTRQKEILDKAYNLALQNSFATKLTSLAVPDFDDSLSIQPENDKQGDEIPFPEYTPTVFESWISSAHQTSLHCFLKLQLILIFTMTFVKMFMH